MLKKYILLGLGLISSALMAEPVRQSIFVGGVPRTYYLFTPSATQLTGYPIIFVYHGYTMGAASMMNYTQMNSLAEKNGFLVAYLDGRAINGNDDSEHAQREWNGASDVTFTRELLRHIRQQFPIDPNRLYLAGFSEGGMMTLRLACEMADTFAAFAAVAGYFNESDCRPARPMPGIFLHGTSDRLVPSEGEGSNNEELHFWVRNNQCRESAGPVALPDVADDGTRSEKFTFSECNSGAEIQYIKENGAGHHWAGADNSYPWVFGRQNPGSYYFYKSWLGQAVDDFSASEEIWSFLRRHSLR